MILRVNAFQLAVAITAANVLIAAGFSIAPFAASLDHRALVLAGYAAARAIPLAVGTIWAISAQKWQIVSILGMLAGVIQAADALVGVVDGSAIKIAGPALVALAQVWASRTMTRSLR